MALSSAAGRYIFVRGEPPTCVHIRTQLYNKETLLLRLLIFYVTPLMSELDINQGAGIVYTQKFSCVMRIPDFYDHVRELSPLIKKDHS